MGPKKARVSAPKKNATHGTYKDMIRVAIVQLKDRMGSSRQAIKKYVKANNNLGATTETALSNHINSAIYNGVKAGDFLQPKGTSGPVKLAKKATAAAKPATTAKKPASSTAKKPAAKKATTTKKATSTTKKAAAPKTKANVAKPRKAPAKKTPTAAPAIEEKKQVVTGKTKSGRVTKTSAPTSMPKKVAAKKTGTPKKAA